MSRSLIRLLCAALLAVMILGVTAAQASRLPAKKKLLEYGWDVPTPEFIRQNIRSMERKPFDGVIMRVAGGKRGNIFSGGKWPLDSLAEDRKHLRMIHWDKFTDNFIMLYSASEMDWFSDKDWEGVLSNVRLMAQAAKEGHCSLAFDAEPYGKNPWAYSQQKQANQKSFAEYQAMAFKRGTQFIGTIQKELPDCTLVTLFTYSLFRRLMDTKDPALLEKNLRGESYALYLPFLNGMLSAAGPGITITDGNEPSYYYTSSEAFFDVYHAMRQGALSLLPRALVNKFLTQTQASQALYMDYVFARVPWKNIPALYMTPEERAKWFRHNVYYALKTTDEYVWLYSEKMNWWQDKDIPEGMEAAIVAARQAIAEGKPLGFSMADIMKRVADKKEADIAANLIRRQADVPAAAGRKAIIDGDLTDGLWVAAAHLDPFVGVFGSKPGELKAKTLARLTWDADNLYVAVECDEPTGKLDLVGERRDDSVWMGDSLDLFLTAEPSGSPYYHFILNPKNVQWDARYDLTNEMEWDPTWQSATKIGDKWWRAEMAIPWAALKITPRTGLTLRANFCRQRRADQGELSSWSQVLTGFMEPEHFGTLVLR